jgi:hypothetical protein
MQAFQNDEARLQAESLPLLLPHAKKIGDLTNSLRIKWRIYPKVTGSRERGAELKQRF